MKQTDANRTAYIRQVYGHDWTHPSHYDLVLDTGRLGYEVAANVILAALPGRSR
ncbi:MAG: cytidylate kinase family protein [Candidatus Dormibacteraceae bacterium]